MLKAVIFDYDDTLVKTRESKWDALKETGERFYNLDISSDHIKKFWGRPFKEMLTQVLMKADSFDNLKKAYFSVAPEFPMQPHLGSLQAVNQLLKKFDVGILTASDKKLVIDDLELLDFPIDKFFFIQTAEDTNTHKPDPAVFRPILNQLKAKNISKSEVIYVGDSLIDYFASRDAGIKFYGIALGTTSKKEFKDAGTQSIDTFQDLLTQISQN